MSLSRTLGLAFKSGLLGLLLMVCLGAEYLHLGALPWQFLNQALAEVFAIFQAADVQWLIVICISVYFLGFIWMHRSWNRGVDIRACLKTPQILAGDEVTRLKHPCFPGRHAEEVSASSRRLLLVNEALSRNAPLVAGVTLYGIGSLAYALNYDQASKSTDTLVLCFGITLFFGFRFWRAIEAKRSQPFNIAGMVFAFTLILLSIAVVWHPESVQSFQYRRQVRWSGLWDNPNVFGMLMGVGLVLALGRAVSGIKFQEVPGRENKHPTSTGKAWCWVKFVLFLIAAGLCGLGLVRSYSRGAWLGAMCGLGFLKWNWTRRTAHLTPALSPRPTGGEGEEALSCVSWFKRNWRPVCVILASVLVVAFWNFRYTERLVARRAFSVGNVNDFSWRNRVAAYQGSLQMMASRPLFGYGWNQPHQVYELYYRPAKVDDGAAIQMNDYFTLGTTLGAPALVCFVAFIGLTLVQKSEVRSRKSEADSDLRSLTSGLCAAWRAPVELQPSAFSLQPSGFCLPSVCRAGTLVLLVGFWFDGGLFKLATGAAFWILLALGNKEHNHSF